MGTPSEHNLVGTYLEFDFVKIQECFDRVLYMFYLQLKQSAFDDFCSNYDRVNCNGKQYCLIVQRISSNR